MSAIKRTTVLLVELTSEVLLLGCLLGALVSSKIGFLYGAGGSVLAVPVVLFLHGYYLTRAFFGAVWRSQTPLAYPATAAALFVAHMYFAFVRLNPDMSSFARATELPFLAGGASIVFACFFWQSAAPAVDASRAGGAALSEGLRFWVPLDKNEGVVKQHFAFAVFFAPRGCQRVGGQ